MPDTPEPGTHWWVGNETCTACGHHAVGVVPIWDQLGEPQAPTECGACGRMAMVPHA